jgi:hypothetical protein
VTVFSPSLTSRRSIVVGVLLATFALLAPPSAFPQVVDAIPTGRIAGRIIDARTGLGLSDVGIQVVGTTRGTMSGIDGRYSLPSIDAGTVTLHVRRIGYQPKTITGIYLDGGAALEQNITLDEAITRLTPTIVTAAAERGTVNAALDAQRMATGVVSSVTSEQIARSPDSDAAQAVQRVSGVTVQDGKYVSVRGLGDRYTTTSLNGARLPSPEPERKVVPLDLFPASLLQSVTISKTFTPDQPGDFSGAQVDLRTREFPAGREISYSMSLGYNARATGKNILAAPHAGAEWLALGTGARRLPGSIAAAGNFSQSPTQPEYNEMVSSLRNAWSVRRENGAPNTSMGLTIGGHDPLLGRQIGYVGSLSYSHSQEVRADEERAFAVPQSDDIGGVGTGEVDRFAGSTGRSSVLWGGLLNLSTLLGTSGRLSLNNTYTRSADNEARYEHGIDENVGFPLQISRLRYVERGVRSTQLAGEHDLGGHRLDWSLTATAVTRREPDRSEVVYATDEAGGTPFLFGGNEGAVRTFGELTENSYGSAADYTFHFDRGERQHALKVGLLGRYTHRDARNSSYSILANLPREERQRRPEEIFDGRFTESGSAVFSIVPLAQGGSYEAADLLGAGYAMADYQLTCATRLIGGVRVEYSGVEVTTRELFGGPFVVDPSYIDVLPAAALNVQLGENQNLRFSLSQTLARPEYRELVGINQRDVLGGEQFRGNPDLERTLIQNADIRWELYPGAGEVISLGVFAKRFLDPIERVYRGTSGTRVTTFENARRATNYGVEVEIRKDLGFLADPLAGVTVFSNATVMRSEIDLSDLGAGSVEAERAMAGQAPFVVNAGLGYSSASGRTSATVLYNVVGDRIYAASLLPLPSVYEQERHVLDVSARFPVRGDVAIRLDAKNLLDAPYEVTQGSVTREFYRAGRSLSVGLGWRP